VGGARPADTVTAVVRPPGAGGPPATGGLTTAVTVSAGLAPSTRASRPYVRQLGTSPRIRRSIVRRSGIRVSMRVADDATVVRIRVFRKLRNGKRTLVATAWRSPSRAGVYRTRLTNATLRRSLRTGSYEVEATPGASRTNLGTASRSGFRVIRG